MSGGKNKLERLENIGNLIYGFVRKVKYDHVSSFAGYGALFILMSLFPMMMYFVSLIRYIPVDTSMLTEYAVKVIPESFTPILMQIYDEVRAQDTTTFFKSFAIIGTLICASKGVYALIIGMNAVYGIRETRGMVLLYAISVVYVLGFFAIIGLMIVLIVLGNNIFHLITRFVPEIMVFEPLFRYGKYLCMLILLAVFFLVLYINIPNRKSKIRYELPGAFFTTVVWLVFSWAFSFYISNFGNYSVTYGSLATIVIFILWLYGSMNIILVGAELNVVLRKYAEYGYNYKMAFSYYEDEYDDDFSIPIKIFRK